MKTATEEVFVVVKRVRGSEGPWELHTTWSSRSGRPYVKPGPAKTIATQLNKAVGRWSDKYEYAVKRGIVYWDEGVIR